MWWHIIIGTLALQYQSGYLSGIFGAAFYGVEYQKKGKAEAKISRDVAKLKLLLSFSHLRKVVLHSQYRCIASLKRNQSTSLGQGVFIYVNYQKQCNGSSVRGGQHLFGQRV